MRTFFVFCCLFFSPLTFAFSEAELITLLQTPQNVQGNFTQQRFLKSLAKPITTQGKFTLLAKKGLLWQMEKPFANQLRVKTDGIMQWDGKQWVANGKMGQTEQINLFLGLLSGDISGLKAQFDVALSGEAKNWQLTLTPSSLLMKQIFTDIQIQGDEVVKAIVLNEKQGDKTHIQFDHVQQNQPLATFAQSALE
ncbi:outer membrane lipoprotein carrier protein LolA [Aggregatibacter actinomycetemcomitans]|uniref:LolA family protein n=1 Tax=Aggregatibacter actinomycetemcomitans TaxID=714 RepID=UPI00197BE4EC|nr:outer membrane lipoprotein carrier protein LolA [Aggregatibacter actinomycetemcomitans]MBN6069938.1 outer membrane lipoprotein carrier protein LolA [Aggregatibacter actinomycetemcomitans]